MRSGGGRDIHCQVQWDDIRVTIVAEGVSWSGEVADDIVTRVVRGFREAVDIVSELEEAEADDE